MTILPIGDSNEVKLNELCPICSRELGTVNVDRHHLIPKCHGGRDQFMVHKICHRKIHATFTEKELEKKFNNWEELRAHPMLQDFIAWVQKKSIDYYASSDNAKRRKR